MPSRKETIDFLKENNITFRGYTTLSINELIERIDSMVSGEMEKKWKRLKLKTDASPMSAERNKKITRREQLKAGPPKKVQATTIEGEIANLMATSDRLEAQKKKPKKAKKPKKGTRDNPIDLTKTKKKKKKKKDDDKGQYGK